MPYSACHDAIAPKNRVLRQERTTAALPLRLEEIRPALSVVGTTLHPDHCLQNGRTRESLRAVLLTVLRSTSISPCSRPETIPAAKSRLGRWVDVLSPTSAVAIFWCTEMSLRAPRLSCRSATQSINRLRRDSSCGYRTSSRKTHRNSVVS